MTYKILDTNIILLDANNIISLGSDGSTIVLPETVINELDSKKSVEGEIGYQARAFGRLITKGAIGKPRNIEDLTITSVHTEGTNIEIVSSSSYPNIVDVEHNIRNDRKIIEIALQYKNIFTNDLVQFISNDVMCRISSNSLGIDSTDLKEVENTSFEFTKELTVSDSVFRAVHRMPITQVDLNYLPENFNYKFVNEDTGQVKLGAIYNKHIDILGKETENQLRRQDINPINSDQLLFSNAIQEPTVDIIVAEAPAGSGKTLSALSNAMTLVKRNTPYESILYIRASIDDVDKVEQVGFLSGNAEKFEVYLHPLEDSLDFIARNRFKKKANTKQSEYETMIAEKIATIKEDYNIQGISGLGLRGRTFSNAVVIIDEIQGQSKASLQKMITRFGKNCKIILIGSQKQIDNPYVTKFNNGLSVVLNDAALGTSEVNIHVVPLPSIVRSDIAKWGERIFTGGEYD